ERQKTIAAERQREEAVRFAEIQRLKYQDESRQMQENMQQLVQKQQQMIQHVMEHQNKVVDDRLKESERLLKEGFIAEAAKLRNNAEGLENQLKEYKNKTHKREENVRQLERIQHDQFQHVLNQQSKALEDLKEQTGMLKDHLNAEAAKLRDNAKGLEALLKEQEGMLKDTFTAEFAKLRNETDMSRQENVRLREEFEKSRQPTSGGPCLLM
ncbi:hypothetical protein ACJMK2_039917, partial [Sinanodonta woodiana]